MNTSARLNEVAISKKKTPAVLVTIVRFMVYFLSDEPVNTKTAEK